MKNEEYQAAAVRTESNDFNAIHERLTPQKIRLLHGALGVVTESAEFADAIKKHLFYGKPLDEINLSEEVGDLFWYCAIIADALGDDFHSIMRRNIAKLRARYPNKFTEAEALDRDLSAEREILEKRYVVPRGGIGPHDFNDCGGDPTVCSRCSMAPDAEVHKTHDFNECGGDPTVCSRCSMAPDAEVHKTLPVESF